MSVIWSTEKELENLIKMFLSARDMLLDTIINTRGVGTKVYANTVLKQLQTQFKALEKQSAFYVQSVIPAGYQSALDEIYTYFKKNNLLMKPPVYFASLHNDAIYAIAREMQYQIGQGLEQAGRQIVRYVNDSRDDALRQAGLNAAGEKFATGGTLRAMRDNLIGKLRTQGFMTVQYGSGPGAYQVPIDTYSAMVARSTTREVGNIARENQLTSNGYDLVKITEHYPTCKICAPLQGRVYSISGKDSRFPPLTVAFRNGYHNVHPNCRHVIVPWIESLQTSDELQQAMTQSSAPFEDSRNHKEITLYEKQQAQNRQVRQDLYQYERYKARLGGDAPASFHSFRQLKSADSDKWNKMQRDYLRRCRLSAHPDLALPNAQNAVAEEAKFTRYFFGGINPDGLSKGIAFNSHLGYNIGNWKQFQKEILSKTALNPAKYDRETEHGKYYNQPMILYGHKKNPMDILTVWEVKNDQTRFITAHPNRGEK